MLAQRKTVSYEGGIILRARMYRAVLYRQSTSSLTAVGVYPSACAHLSPFDAGGWTGDGITLPGAIDLEGTAFNLLIFESVLTLRVTF
jgi:hypothetical protein